MYDAIATQARIFQASLRVPGWKEAELVFHPLLVFQPIELLLLFIPMVGFKEGNEAWAIKHKAYHWGVSKISSSWVNTTSRWGIKQLEISFGSIFLLFFDERSWGPHSQQPGEAPAPASCIIKVLVLSCLVGFNLSIYSTYLFSL